MNLPEAHRMFLIFSSMNSTKTRTFDSIVARGV
jgi:hypothetical protein